MGKEVILNYEFEKVFNFFNSSTSRSFILRKGRWYMNRHYCINNDMSMYNIISKKNAEIK